MFYLGQISGPISRKRSEEKSMPFPNMIAIPGGPFLMGTSPDDIKQLQLKESDWAYDWYDNDLFVNEQPQQRVDVAKFEIAQYPVTNYEYYLFVRETAHRLPRGWLGFTYPDDMGNHPVVSVSKTDAEAYIRWLNEQTRSSFRLPTETEWERAARSTDGRIFPWGNVFDPWRCNTSDSGKRGTTPVGTYSPGGDSPYGVADMVGNVWEWTSSVFRPYAANDGDERNNPQKILRYVIRGGSWYYSRKLARCAAREGMDQHTVSNSIGFRLARTPASG